MNDAAEATALRCPSCGSAAPVDADRCVHCGSALRTKRCASCFRLNEREAERCARCGKILPAVALAADASGACPACTAPFVARHAGPIGYAECERCGGLFLRPKAFEMVSSDADTRAHIRIEAPGSAPASRDRAPAPVHYRPCPDCRKLMNRTNYAGGSGIIVDVCREHGVFLDRGEMSAIVDFLEGGGFDRVKKRERDRLAEDLRTLESQKRIAASIAMPAGAGDRDVQGWRALSGLVDFLGDHLFRR